MTKEALQLLAPLLATLALGCSSSATAVPDAGTDVDTDADTDADTDTYTDTDTDTQIDIWDWTCSVPLDTTCDEVAWETPSAYDLQVNAASFTDLTFVRASRSPIAILAERVTDSGPEPIVVLHRNSPDEFVEVGVVPPPAEPLSAIDIATPDYLDFNTSGLGPADEVLGYAAVALLCGASSCALYGLSVDGNSEPIGLEPIPGGEVPLSVSRAISWTPGFGGEDVYINDRVCVAGDGIACFDEDISWWEALEAGGSILNAIDIQDDADGLPSGLVAAGDGGRITTHQTGEWTEIDSGTSMDLLSISAYAGFWAAGGPNGFVFGDYEHVIQCEFGSAYTAMFVHESNPNPEAFLSLTALTGDHVVEIVGTSAGFSACVKPNDFSGEPRNADYYPGCADVVCGYALTTGGLYSRDEYGTFPG